MTAAPLTITASNISKCFNSTYTFTGSEFSSSGLKNSDAVSSVTLTSAGSAASATVAGSPYTIVPSFAQGTGLNNYSITYNNGSLTVKPLPTVTKPLDQVRCNGIITDAINLSGSAIPGTVYNWTNNLTSIGLAASGSASIPSFTAINSGTSPVTATVQIIPVANLCSGMPVTYTYLINPSLVITSSPAGKEICSGTNTTFTGAATGADLTYQWRRWGIDLTNNTKYSGVNSNTLTLTGATPDESGEYSLYVTSNCGTASTSNALLTVKAAPVIQNQPNNANTCDGGNTMFETYVTGGGLSYQWKENGVNITNGGVYSGANTSTLNLVGVGSSFNNRTYSVEISNGCLPNAVSNSGTLTITNNVSPSVGLVNTVNNVCEGTQVEFTAYPTNGGLTPSYQWKVNGVNVGLNQNTYSSSVLANNDVVTVVITSSLTCVLSQTATSNPVTMVIYSKPVATITSPNVSICNSTSTNITGNVTANGAWSLTLSNGSIVSGSGAGAFSQSVSPTTTTTYTITALTDAQCSSVPAGRTGSTVVTVNPLTFTWTGAQNSNWNSTGNWSCAIVPSSSNDVTIPNTSTSPVIPATPTAVVRDLNISGSSTLTLSNNGVLQVYGNWNNSGTFATSTGTVEFVGSGTQTLNKLSGYEEFYHLNVNKSGTLVINSNTLIKGNGTLLVQAGTLDVSPTYRIILQSLAPLTEGGLDRTARLGRVDGSITQNSTMEVQRYIDIPSFRAAAIGGSPLASKPPVFLSSPVTNATAADWADNMLLNFGAHISTYSELNATGINTGWRNNVTSGSILSPGKGYKVVVGRDNSDDLVSVTGKPLVGNLSYPVTYTPEATEGWNLLGNPYASEIDWETLYANNNSILSPNLYILDPYNSAINNSSYMIYQAGTGIINDPRGNASQRTEDEHGRYIPSSQGFFVKAIASGNVIFSEDIKPAGQVPVYANLRKSSKELIRLLLSDSSTLSETILNFNSNATAGYEPVFDAENISSGTNLYTVSENRKLSINGLPYHNHLQLPLVAEFSKRGKKFIRIKESSVQFTKLYLQDLFLNKFIELTEGTEYSFEASESGLVANRFKIVTDIPVVTSVSESFNSNGSIMVYPNPATSVFTVTLPDYSETNRIEVLDLNGNLVYFETKGLSGPSVIKLPSSISAGVYTVKCFTTDHIYTTKIVVAK